MGHCDDNAGDRKLGQFWEREFCKLATDYKGYMFTPMQIGHDGSIQAFSQTDSKWNHFTLPDVTVWTYPGQHHEIKHKNPTRFDSFGLEAYRFYALHEFAKETKQDVMYTIHNHDLSGGRDAQTNNIAHWMTVDILKLNHAWVFAKKLSSWVNGKEESVLQYFWPTSLWMPLADYWRIDLSLPQESHGP
jgi:hypothetical protein